MSLDRQSCVERENVNLCSGGAERGEKGGWMEGWRERNGPCFFSPFTLCVPRLKASSPFFFCGTGARYMFGVLFVKREQVLVR